ncbi:MAG: Flp pilus assembly protein CpaB [Proteobacteria bacterium]|nr:Flp pilus assembly protein CpaB [Pseudomonadota bacterium]
MNSKAMGLSIVMAGIAVFFVVTSVDSIKEESRTKYGKDVTVLVASEDINEMSTIYEKVMEPKVVPSAFVEPTAIRFTSGVTADSVDFKNEVKRLVGNVALVSIKKGEQLTLNKIAEASMRTGLAPQITRGRRAFSIQADDNSAVTRLLKPGDRVDVISVIDTGSGVGGKESKVAKTILQDVVVLAVGRNITNNFARRVDYDPTTGRERVRNLTEYDGYSTITLEVEPIAVQQLAAIIAGSGNRIMFSLRNNDDTDRGTFYGSKAGDVLNDGSRLPASTPGSGGK